LLHFKSAFESGKVRCKEHKEQYDNLCTIGEQQITKLRNDLLIQACDYLPYKYNLSFSITFRVPGLSQTDADKINRHSAASDRNSIKFIPAKANATKISYTTTTKIPAKDLHEEEITLPFMEILKKENILSDAVSELQKDDPDTLYKERFEAASNSLNKHLDIITNHRNPFWDLLNDIYYFFAGNKNNVEASSSPVSPSLGKIGFFKTDSHKFAEKLEETANQANRRVMG
jgi:hypothetical protein